MNPFDESADMRLLEHQRKALGIEAPSKRAWSAPHTDLNDGLLTEESTPSPPLRGARIAAALSALPGINVIAGTVVTLSLAIQNEGTEPGRSIIATVPLPSESRLRPGTLVIDGRSADSGSDGALVGNGLPLGDMQAGQRITLIWKIDVLPGTKSLVIVPHVQAQGAAVLGSMPLRITRATMPSYGAVPSKYKPREEVPERPFYELDEDEVLSLDTEIPPLPKPVRAEPILVMPDLVVEAPPELAAPSEPPALPAPKSVKKTASPAQKKTNKAPAKPRAKAASKTTSGPVAIPDPVVASDSAAVPQPEPAAIRALFCPLESVSLELIKKLFDNEFAGALPHYALQNALACAITSNGRRIGLREHLAAQNGMLSRALLMRKLGKAISVSEFARGELTFPALREAVAQPGTERPSLLFTELTDAEIEFCERAEEKDALSNFVRLRQLAVTLQARRVRCDDDVRRKTIESLLDQYAQAARTTINRIFVRSKLDRNFDVFSAPDGASTAIARGLIAELEQLLTA